jgi:hypothetical protein
MAHSGEEIAVPEKQFVEDDASFMPRIKLDQHLVIRVLIVEFFKRIA